MSAFKVTISVDDVMDREVEVPALPPLGAMINLTPGGTFKVKEIEFAGGLQEPLKVVLRCVPILSF